MFFMTERETKLYFNIAGLITISSGLLTILYPSRDSIFQFGLDTTLLPVTNVYASYWPYIVCLIGLLMIIASKVPVLRVPIAIYSTLEKLYLIGLILLIMHQSDALGTSYKYSLIIYSIICLYGSFYLGQYNRN
ncbi:hypothetical protein [Flammeovirga kamogawensis]|uniref:hypothetical protein n=1 Tax=Flammeovirga kamogawensis TaxID=373891 RepID=UPI00160B7736|nr:hypothetical protein [Flammeovirga kamogawensis]MBB6459791.1 hypothetical protein [Flammeovirga kamogawensis]